MSAVRAPQHRIASKGVGGWVLLVDATGIEQCVFETVTSVFNSCKGAAQGSSCDHEPRDS